MVNPLRYPGLWFTVGVGVEVESAEDGWRQFEPGRIRAYVYGVRVPLQPARAWSNRRRGDADARRDWRLFRYGCVCGGAAVHAIWVLGVNLLG